jgi:hypothetical protein
MTAHDALIAWLTKVLMVAVPTVLLVVIVSAVAIYGASGRSKRDD